ncbi:MAG: hypothetical protein M1836_004670 [Candelina mexicana]|nr:MAG: hypothetical protein M1836_004670 [Candelina mexicana]
MDSSSHSNINQTLSQELSWRHPLSQQGTVPDAATAERFGLEHLNWKTMLQDFSFPFELQDASSLPPLSLSDCHSFCGKAAAMYAVVDLDGAQYHLFNRLYKLWFLQVPSDVWPGSRFFAKFIASWQEKSPKTPGDVIKVHRILSEEVQRQVHEDLDFSQSAYSHRDDTKHHHLYRLLPTFPNVLIIVDSPDLESGEQLLIILDSIKVEGVEDLEKAHKEEIDGRTVLTFRAEMRMIMEIVLQIQRKEEGLSRPRPYILDGKAVFLPSEFV